MSKNICFIAFVSIGIALLVGIGIKEFNKQAEFYCLTEGSNDPHCESVK